MEVLYMQYESERIEYKSQMIDDIYKEVIAFANTDGGVIYLGIDDLSLIHISMCIRDRYRNGYRIVCRSGGWRGCRHPDGSSHPRFSCEVQH